MDTRVICLKVMAIVTKRHPNKIPTHIIFDEIDSSNRSIQRQIKFLIEAGYLERHLGYKIGLSKNENTN